MKQKRCIIAGAGIGGLATAVRLAAKGHDVTVIEQNDRPGGKMGEIRREGFRFDTGPSLFTLPEMVDELLAIGNTEQNVPFRYKKLSASCRYFFEDGTQINAPDDPGDFAREINMQTGEPPEHVIHYLEDAARLYRASAGLFIFNARKRLFQTALKEKPSRLFPLLKVNPLRTMHEENRRRFRSPHVIQLFDRYATYNGSSPYLTPSMLTVIAHLEHNTGAYFPEKGMYSIAQAIYEKAVSLGVDFRLGCKVTGLNTRKRQITGVETTQGTFPCDALISDIDVNMFYRQAGKKLKRPHSVKHPRLSSSALIFYWGMNTTFPQLDMHNILFSVQYTEEFTSLFKKREPFTDPTVYIFVSSKTVEEDAPPGKENWFVMINVPPLAGSEFPPDFVERARGYIISKIKRVLHIDPSPHILFEERTTPQTLQEFTGSYKGALYGNSSNSIWSAFLRHPNRSATYPNLYFTGGSVHPGGGIPLCLASAAIVENEMEKAQ
ncbi:MAG: 1-hydroxycarotenoid 3,4-desaturase CrtD [Marinilabiliaceae bacterium]